MKIIVSTNINRIQRYVHCTTQKKLIKTIKEEINAGAEQITLTIEKPKTHKA